MDTTVRVGIEDGSLARDGVQRSVRRGEAANGDSVCPTEKGEARIIANNRCDTTTRCKGDRMLITAIDVSGRCVDIKQNLVLASRLA